MHWTRNPPTSIGSLQKNFLSASPSRKAAVTSKFASYPTKNCCHKYQQQKKKVKVYVVGAKVSS